MTHTSCCALQYDLRVHGVYRDIRQTVVLPTASAFFANRPTNKDKLECSIRSSHLTLVPSTSLLLGKPEIKE